MVSTNIDPILLESMKWRCIGPPRGGRVVAAAGDPNDPMVFYFGAVGGGVWKTTDGGTYWEPITDNYFTTSAVGAIAVSDSDPNVIYAGTGEACIRGNVTHGDGVYKSTDAGKSWKNMGLNDSRHISRIRIHPKNPDIVYVAALGHAFGPNKERGIFKSTDGGSTWNQVLYKSDEAGAADLSMDITNPRILYAAIWQAKREPFNFTSGGPDSGIHKSTDGGDTWEDISSKPGLPDGIKGRIGIAVSPAKPGRVWAIIEADKRGLYRSEDGGDTWELINEDANLMQRPWYYSHVYADPQNPNVCYILNLNMWKSTDGGNSFNRITTPHGDNHELWIDPKNPQRMIEGNDGGACVSFNGGETWSTIYNQLTAQFYHLTTDNQFPYRVYATQQDNSAISVPSRTNTGAIPWSECYAVGSSESGYIAVDPKDPNVIFSGAIGSSPGGGDSLLRYDHKIGQTRIVSVWPEYQWGTGIKDHKYRFQWTYPIVFSPHDPDTLYVTAQYVFRSFNGGESWEIISPDLTRGDKSKMEPSGGPITLDTTMVEHYGTIFAFSESPHEKGTFWTGSDDGLIHLSKDGGESWNNVTPSDLPEWTRIDIIEISPHNPAKAYIAATRYKWDDYQPMLYKTDDYGATWTKINDGIEDEDITRVIRADPEREGLLYVGTETKVYVSFNDGKSWQSLRSNMPITPISDLVVKDNELVVATNGRSFWILDDLAALRQINFESTDKEAFLLSPGLTFRQPHPVGAGRPGGSGKNYMLGLGYAGTFYEKMGPDGDFTRVMLDCGENPPSGVVVHYYLNNSSEDEISLTFYDEKDVKIRSFSSKELENTIPVTKSGDVKHGGPVVSKKPGMNRFIWDMRYPGATKPKIENSDTLPDSGYEGPVVPPGTYKVHLETGSTSIIKDFEIRKDPRILATQDDFQEQFDLLIKIRDKISDTYVAFNQISSVKTQIDSWVSRATAEGTKDKITSMANEIKDKLESVETEIVQSKTLDGSDRISAVSRLDGKIKELSAVPASAEYRPTKQSIEVFQDLSIRIDNQLSILKEIVNNDVPKFVDMIHELEIPEIDTAANN